MLPSSSVYRHSLRAFSLLALGAVLAAFPVAQLAAAQGTHLWTQSRMEEFEKGTPQGVALGSDGALRAGPGLTERATTPSTYVWSVAVDKSGTVYAGTGSPATVLRIGPDGKEFTLFKSKDLSVQVVALGPDGALYAATLPSGKVYRLDPRATTTEDDSGVKGKGAEVVFDAGAMDGGGSSGKAGDADKTGADKAGTDKAEKQAHYIWAMTFDAEGRLYIATGGPAAVYRVDAAKTGAKPEAFFKSDEAHIRSLAWDAEGNLIAGSDGSGLVYRISSAGKGYVLFEAPRREITALAVGADGTIYAASVGEKSKNPLPALPVQGTGSLSINVFQPDSLQAVNASSSVPEGSEIFALKKDQAPEKLWSDKDAIVYALLSRPDGLLALTGNHGRIFEIARDGSYADVARIEAQQGLSLAVAPGSGPAGDVLIGTGNTGKLVVLGASAEKHEYASDVLDAGAMARFGRVEIEPGSAGYEIFTRTGNVEQPVRGWTDWEPLKEGRVASPAGRYLQWKAVLEADGRVGSVGVDYLPVNAAPVVDDVVVVPGARVNATANVSQPETVSISFASAGQDAASSFDANSASTPLQAVKDRTAVTVRWAAHDANGDSLVYSLYLRGDGETVWRLLKDKLTETAYSFDADLIPDGGYQIKVVASDAPSHSPGEALTGEKVSDRFVVDTTPPVVSGLKATFHPVVACAGLCLPTIHVTFDATDATSPIAHAEYSLDAGPWQYIDPVGGLSDSLSEHYDVTIPVTGDLASAEHLITVRAYDRYENVTAAKTVIRAEKTGPGTGR